MQAVWCDGCGSMRTDYTMVRGDDRDFTLDLVNADGTVPTLAGATITMLVDDLFSTTDIDVDESSGEATVSISAANTVDAPNQRVAYTYVVVVEQADGAIITPSRGLLILLPTVDSV